MYNIKNRFFEVSEFLNYVHYDFYGHRHQRFKVLLISMYSIHSLITCYYFTVQPVKTATTGFGVAKFWPTHGCKSAASTSKKMLQMFNILLDTKASKSISIFASLHL